VVGEFLVNGVAGIPALREVRTRCRDELALEANSLEELHQILLELEDDDGVDSWPASVGVALLDPAMNDAEIGDATQAAFETAPACSRSGR
jgi:hypothetical protein